MIRILVTGPGTHLCESIDQPEVGSRYNLEDAIDGTLAQNKLFHALITEYWVSGSSSAESLDDLRNGVKLKLGAGFDAYVYAYINAAGLVEQSLSTTWKGVPDEVKEAHKQSKVIFGRLRSWSNYTLKMRKTTIDRLIAEMIQAGINSRKFQEILAEIEYDGGNQ